MTYRVDFSSMARVDLLEAVAGYLAYSDASAQRMNQGVESTVDILRVFPKAGRNRSSLSKGLRSFPTVNRYIIYYRMEHDRVEVVRILHGSRNQRAALREKHT